MSSTNTARALERADTDWLAVARDLSRQFVETAAERERLRQPPIDELKALRASGIVNLVIPKRYGGEGNEETLWLDVVRVVAEIAKADPNIGVLLAYHFHNFVPPILDFAGDNAAIQRKSAANRWLWGHVTHPYIPNFYAEPQPNGGLIIRGTKPMNTGAPTGDVTTVLAERTDRREFIYSVIPTDRNGITYIRDWDHLGLRRTDTSTMVFDDVVVEPHEVLVRSHAEPFVQFPPFYTTTGALAFGATYLGAAHGALEQARDYLQAKPAGPRGRAAEDPFVQARIGEYWAKVQAGHAYLETVAREFDDIYARRRNLDQAELGRLNARADAFRIFAGEIGIEIGSGIYDAVGATATANSYGFDRYFRDVRIHSLHVFPPIYSDRNLGNFFVNGEAPRGPKFLKD